MIKVLVVEDSSVVREFLVHSLESDPDVRVVGTASNGADALDAVRRSKPDVISMDMHMPGLDGFEATRRIMETHPTPIVIVSGSSDAREVASTFRTVEVGALAVVPRPRGIDHPEHETTVREFVQTVKLMSEVKVVRRWARLKATAAAPPVRKSGVLRSEAEIRVVAIGASTGGPIAVQTILQHLRGNFAPPLLLVQHMSAGFVQGFTEWLGQTTGFSVAVASHAEPILPRHVYVAPDGFQMGVGKNGQIVLTEKQFLNGLRPSVAYLFRSVADAYGRNAVGVLLTGMGKDGAEELKQMKGTGAITITQDEATSVVDGMPGEARRLDAATYVLSLDKIAAALSALVNGKRVWE